MHELVNCEEAKTQYLGERHESWNILLVKEKKKEEEAIGTSNSDIRSM